MPLNGIHCPPILSLRVYAERRQVLQRVTELPFSPVAVKILELAQDERVGAREIADIVAQDQSFTARLLKIANSPYYGQTRAVTTVSQAVPHKILKRPLRSAIPMMRKSIRQAHRNAGVTIGCDLVSARIGSRFFRPCRRQRARWIGRSRPNHGTGT